MSSEPTIRTVNAFQSKLTVIAVQVGDLRYKAFQVFFTKDGSLFVSFPYFRHREGILAATASPGTGHPTSHVDLTTSGKVTSHLVKYSHHPDGRAHFSQTKKVRTEVKRQSLPLNEYRGHIFSLHIQGINAFETADETKDIGTNPKRTTLTFQVEQPLEDAALKFVGYWYELSTLPAIAEGAIGPSMTLIDPTGAMCSGLLIASPYADAHHVLCISCQRIPRLGPEPEILNFIGGFDRRSIMDDTSREAGFVSFIYPIQDAERLKNSIGSIDL
jgi:hypothetical protein